ncbi:MAG TPA: leucine-rich repeat domain-containing protein [Paludibacter sp.]|nr:leucine-rich repeat domain-containing protein [Paludibacter sp.]
MQQFGIVPFIAPIDFNMDSQELNIYNEFVYQANANKRVIFSVPTTQATTVLTWTGVHTFIYAREINGVMTYNTAGNPTTTVTWEAGSTKRHVIVLTATENASFAVPSSAEWVYVGRGVSGISISGNTVKYIHCFSLDSITSISANAFLNKTLLTGTLTIPNSVSTIASSAFAGATGLTGSLTFHSGVTSIAINAFQNCTGLTGTLVFLNPDTTLADGCFSSCIFTGAFNPPANMTSIGSSVFSGNQFSGACVIPAGVTSIGSTAFSGCNKFTSLTLNNALTTINTNAFQNCTSLTGDLTIPASVTSILNFAFLSCTGLNGALTILNKDISIGTATNGAVFGSTAFTALNLPVGYVGNGAMGKLFNFSSNFSAASLNQSILNLPDNFGTLTIGATNKTRWTTAFPSAQAAANARGITIV